MKQPNPTLLAQMGLLLGTAMLAIGCSGSSSATATSTPTSAESCAALAGMTIPGSAIGGDYVKYQPKGATVTSATFLTATDTANKSGVEHCRVVGVITPATDSEVVTDLVVDMAGGSLYTVVTTPDINFEVNLPSKWNNKTFQAGGGGFDGSIPSEADTTNSATATANGITSPLARGYVTLGSDSGHTSGGMPSAIWNDEALRNFGREQIKKTHDVAMAIVKNFYGSAPKFNYFMGGSQGGHEALIAARFYPYDFDGVIVGFPAYDLEAMHPGAIDYSKALYNAHTATDGYSVNTSNSSVASAGYGWVSRAQMAAVSTFIINACDALDGATDGIVSDSGACKTYLTSQGYDLYALGTANPLRCTAATGRTAGQHTAAYALGSDSYNNETCLSDVQIESLKHITSRYNFASGITLEGGTKSYGKWPMLDGIWFSADATKDPSQEDFGGSYLPVGFAPWLGADGAFQSGFPTTDQLNMLTRHSWDTAIAMSSFDITQWKDRVEFLSSVVDTNSVDYEEFRGRGGKLIHYHGSSDVSITPYNSIDLYLRMTGQFLNSTNNDYLGTNPFWGTSDLSANAGAGVRTPLSSSPSNGAWDNFYSFYLIPGMGHGHGYFAPAVDWLTALETWREKATVPGNNLVSTDVSTAHTSLGQRPVCAFPYYPKFKTGVTDNATNRAVATNYTCTQLAGYTHTK